MLDYNAENIFETIMAMPNAPNIIQKVQDKLEEEKQKRTEFYNDITEQQKAEFINGEIVIHSPVKKRHTDVERRLFTLISLLFSKIQKGFLGYEKNLIKLTRNDYEPDICYFKEEKSKDFKDDEMFFPAPDFVVEILSPSIAKNDRGIKFQDYETHKVQEYWIIDPDKEILEIYHLNGKGKYELFLKSGTGIATSNVISGFTVNIRAIFDDAENTKELQKIINS